MNVPDQVTTGITTGIAVTTLSQAAKQGQDFISAVCGHPGESLGTIVGNWTKRRFENMYSIGHRSELILLDLGVSPKVDVPLKVMGPLVESASLEEEPELQERWANLLANAVDPRRPYSINAVFPYLLRDLGPREVKFIDSLYEECTNRMRQMIFFKRVSQIMYGQLELMKRFSDLGFSTVPIYEANFENQQHPEYAHDTDAFFLMLDLIRRHDVIRETILPPDAHAGNFDPGERVHHFTELGVAFVIACRPPMP